MRRLPARSKEIEHYVERDEGIRSACDDLAAAEQTLSKVDSLPEAVRAARREEYTNLIQELTAEIERALDRAKDT